MRSIILYMLVLVINITCFAQENDKEIKSNSYNLFDCKNCENKLFIASSSGLQYTPIGIKIGFLCKTGAYLGTRFGQGKIYHSDSDYSTTTTTLFSITGGLIKPIYIKNKFSLYILFGAGYGQWWHYRWERWTKDGYELEGGLIISYNRIMINLNSNMLNGYKTYATFDFTLGVGYRF